MKGKERADDYATRRERLATLTEPELEERFWALADRLTKPLVELARTHTTPAIERSVLLRMGFSSMEAKGIVDHCAGAGLMGKGAGHVVLRMARRWRMPLRDAGLRLGLGEGWDEAATEFAAAETVGEMIR